MSQAKTFVFGASKLTPNPTARHKITPDAEWTQHHTPNREYTDSTECTRSFGFYEDNDDDENLEENNNGTPMNDPALDARCPLAAGRCQTDQTPSQCGPRSCLFSS
jgi:hypothetical protein